MTQAVQTDQVAPSHPQERLVSRRRAGLLAAVAAAHLWAISGVFAKVLMTETLAPSRLVFYRSTLSALVLAAIFLWRDRALPRLRWNELPFFLAMGMGGLALTQFAYYAAIQSLSVGIAILLQYLACLWMLLFERFWLKIPLTRARLAALLLAIAGCALVSLDTGATRRWGNAGVLLALGAGICFASYTLMTRHALKSHRDLTVLFYGFLFSALLWGANLGSWQPLASLGPVQIGMILYVAIFGTLLPFLLYARAVKHLSASHTGIIATLEPVVAGAIAWAFLDETLAGSQIAGGCCVLLAIAILQGSTQDAEQRSPTSAQRT